jgi:hypothetical protein
VVRDEIETLVARERPGWRVAEVLEINDESGPTFEVVVERGDERRTVLVSADERIVGERPDGRGARPDRRRARWAVPPGHASPKKVAADSAAPATPRAPATQASATVPVMMPALASTMPTCKSAAAAS